MMVERLADGALAFSLERGATDEGRTTFLASAAVEDRLGDVIWQRWDLKPFERNRVALYQHDMARPIGRVPHVAVVGNPPRLEATIEWDREVPDGWVGAAVERGTLSAVSVGFTPGGIEARALLGKHDPYFVDAEAAGVPMWRAGFVIGRIGRPNELRELSVVTVPALREAVAVGRGGEMTEMTQDMATRSIEYRKGMLVQARRDMAQEQVRQARERVQARKAEDPGAWAALVAELSQPPDLSHLFGEGIPWLGEGVPWLTK